LLDDVERARHETFAFEADRARFATAVVLTRLLLAHHLDLPAHSVMIDRTCPNCGKGHGRPRPTTGDVVLSVSHAGDWVAVACGRVPAIGVDIEAVVKRDVMHRLVPMVLRPGESGTNLGPIEFTRYWTRKEAVLKATGDGLNVPMTDLAVTPPHSPPAVSSFAGQPDLPSRIHMESLSPKTGYEAALAVIDSPAAPDVTEHDASYALTRLADQPSYTGTFHCR
jgi:4'-phosphopantetheinyl transferase